MVASFLQPRISKSMFYTFQTHRSLQVCGRFLLSLTRSFKSGLRSTAVHHDISPSTKYRQNFSFPISFPLSTIMTEVSPAGDCTPFRIILVSPQIFSRFNFRCCSFLIISIIHAPIGNHIFVHLVTQVCAFSHATLCCLPAHPALTKRPRWNLSLFP